MSTHGWLLIVLAIGAAGLAVAWARFRSQARQGKSTRSAMDYLLVWPIIFQSRVRITDGSYFSGRESIGLLLLLALILLGVIFFG